MDKTLVMAFLPRSPVHNLIVFVNHVEELSWQNGDSEGYWLSDKWYYIEKLGIMYYLGTGWYLSEKFGFVFVLEETAESGWLFHWDLGWVNINTTSINWIWVEKFRFWVYLNDGNRPDEEIFYYNPWLNKWSCLSNYLGWSKIGFE